MMTADRLRPPGVKVTVRRMKFDFEEKGFDAHWHSGSPFISHFWNALSQAFGPGEQFFIDSVRAMRDVVDDPELIEEMEEFVRQEAQHTLQHRKFNRALGKKGYDVARLEQRYATALNLAKRFVDAHGMLEVTMALEHFTAGFAHQYFKNPEIGRGADPKVEALWSWHAAEEAEHKSTAFDVHRRIGGTYLGRIKSLGPSWIMIVAITIVNVADLLAQDGQRVDVKDVVRGLRYLFGWRGLFSRMVPSFLSYFRPSFQPWDEDDSADLARWEAEVGQQYLVQKGVKASGLRKAPAKSTPPPPLAEPFPMPASAPLAAAG